MVGADVPSVVISGTSVVGGSVVVVLGTEVEVDPSSIVVVSTAASVVIPMTAVVSAVFSEVKSVVPFEMVGVESDTGASVIEMSSSVVTSTARIVVPFAEVEALAVVANTVDTSMGCSVVASVGATSVVVTTVVGIYCVVTSVVTSVVKVVTSVTVSVDATPVVVSVVRSRSVVNKSTNISPLPSPLPKSVVTSAVVVNVVSGASAWEVVSIAKSSSPLPSALPDSSVVANSGELVVVIVINRSEVLWVVLSSSGTPPLLVENKSHGTSPLPSALPDSSETSVVTFCGRSVVGVVNNRSEVLWVVLSSSGISSLLVENMSQGISPLPSALPSSVVDSGSTSWVMGGTVVFSMKVVSSQPEVVES